MGAESSILERINRGECVASEELLPLVYGELRRLAGALMAREQAGQTLQATALVHEAYLRLVGPEGGARWEGRGHFFAAAAEAMRRILVENARRKRTLKHGGGAARQPLDPDAVAVPEASEDVLALDECLTRLADVDSRAAEVVKLRYFAGFTIEEAAASLGISRRTADADWSYARAWLLAALRGEAG